MQTFLVFLICVLMVNGKDELIDESLFDDLFLGQDEYIPIIDGEGVPVETHEVQQAKISFAEETKKVHIRNGDLYDPIQKPPVVEFVPYTFLLIDVPKSTPYFPTINSRGYAEDTEIVKRLKLAHSSYTKNVIARNKFVEGELLRKMMEVVAAAAAIVI